ncbi:NAD(+) kinase [Zooshikella marina]|uniref:NAD kinase n=1 Tax=Zooshikella ganghwensis TaxID=202772 RepID=A0A4P9VS26_9GAMM|nr:NAD(+) kinase [Zooshikella ganghwensis]MBU2704394.1 NAD(+) kinase [Zooshikella ganghwensis]RDH44860.1 NAD(+) kinase [Zooshikella ganghwensis]
MEQFKHVGVIGRLGSAEVVETLKRLKKFLLSEGVHVILDKPLADVLPGHGLQVCSHNMMGEVCDLVVVIGGDGSMLAAARALARYRVPVLGINRGRLGFLTDIHPDEIEQRVGEVLAGKYIMESRFLLQAVVKRQGQPIGQSDALNDVVLHPGKVARMIEFEVYIEGQFVYSQRADGLIISTPTGSTGYSLSGGGPIMHPKLDAIVVVPMFPHTLTSRPLVVDGNTEIKIAISGHNTTYPQVICDGQVHIPASPSDTITVAKKPQRLKLIHPLNHNYYEVCRRKLGWGNRLGEG